MGMINFLAIFYFMVSIYILIMCIVMVYHATVIIREIIDRIMERFFPQYYYYDWDEDDEI